MSILRSLVTWIVDRRMADINHFRENPHQVQLDTLRSLLHRAKDTEFGRLYDFKSMTNNEMDVFRERVPVFDYDRIKPWIERVRAGEQHLLWGTEVQWFAKSSGTTSDKSKFIPVSKETLQNTQYQGGQDCLILYASQNPETEIYKGKGLVVGGSRQDNPFGNDFYYGDLSAILMQNMPWFAQFFRSPDLSIALMDEWEQKIEALCDSTIGENITNISGVPSWTLVLIKRILEKTGKKSLTEVWPNLEVFFHGGVSFTPYREQYKALISSPGIKYLETYNASEGFFGIQDDLSSSDLLLMLDYDIYYEFIELTDLACEHPRTLTLEEVQLGHNYGLLISTASGLWRYLIGDTIKFTSLKPYKFKITGRTRHFINAFGEELIIDNAENALRVACEQTGAVVKEYTAAPIFMGIDSKGAHEWLIEFNKFPDDIAKFTDLLDDALKRENSDYEAKRHKSISLELPKIVVAKEGLFYGWLKEKGKLGGQHKIPRLANNREYIDQLLALNK